MKTFENIANWIVRREEILHHGQSIGFVPTMGALHEGHLSLIKKARNENDIVVASIFVNPTQFDNKEDLEKYPKNLTSDLKMLEEAGADIVLLPTANEIYSDNFEFKISEEKDSKILCGAHRPGHFTGVLTIVMKLLGITQAHKCYMGEKDYQQFLLIKKMAAALFIRTEIVPCETLREESGLAMSSRNQRLSANGKNQAALVHKFLSRSSSCENTKKLLMEAGIQVDYVEEHWGRRFAAVTIEDVRLIDNVKV